LVSSNTLLQGTSLMKVYASNGYHDLLAANSITYGGTLNLQNLGGTLASGMTFKLFNASTYSGAFASITPSTPGSGLAWDTNYLTTSGTIGIVPANGLVFYQQPQNSQRYIGG